MQRAVNIVGRAWHAYESCLARNPYAVEMATSTVLWGIGDVLAQRFGEQRSEIDAKRCLMTAAFGCCFMGPVGHLWYSRVLDGIVVGSGLRQGTTSYLAGKVAADCLILGSVYVLAFYLWGSCTIDHTGWQGFKEKVTKDFMSTYAAELTFWPPVQVLNFSKVPLQHQLLAVNMASLVDATFLSYARSQDDWVAAVLTTLRAAAPKTFAAADAGQRDVQ